MHSIRQHRSVANNARMRCKQKSLSVYSSSPLFFHIFDWCITLSSFCLIFSTWNRFLCNSEIHSGSSCRKLFIALCYYYKVIYLYRRINISLIVYNITNLCKYKCLILLELNEHVLIFASQESDTCTNVNYVTVFVNCISVLTDMSSGLILSQIELQC